jgi:hypothetical protein
MAIRRTTKTVLAAAAALALLPGLAACSGGQSVEEACGVLQSRVSEVTTSLQEAMTVATSGDEAAVNEQLGSLKEQLSAIDEEITNDEVSQAYGTFAAAYDDMMTQVQSMSDIDMEDMDALTEASTQLQDSATELTEAGQGIDSVCGG